MLEQFNPFKETPEKKRAKGAIRQDDVMRSDASRLALRAAELRDREMADDRRAFLRARIAPLEQRYQRADEEYADALEALKPERLAQEQEQAWTRTQSELEIIGDLENLYQPVRARRAHVAEHVWSSTQEMGLERLRFRSVALMAEINELEQNQDISTHDKEASRLSIYHTIQKMLDTLQRMDPRNDDGEHFFEKMTEFVKEFGETSIPMDLLTEYKIERAERALVNGEPIHLRGRFSAEQKKRLFTAMALSCLYNNDRQPSREVIDMIDPEIGRIHDYQGRFQKALSNVEKGTLNIWEGMFYSQKLEHAKRKEGGQDQYDMLFEMGTVSTFIACLREVMMIAKTGRVEDAVYVKQGKSNLNRQLRHFGEALFRQINAVPT